MAAFNKTDMQRIAGMWKNVDPQLYEKFLRLLDQWTFEVTVAVTEAPSGEILQAQGRAQQARSFMQVFSEPEETNRTTP